MPKTWGGYSLILGDPPREGVTFIEALAMIAQDVYSSGPQTALAKTRMYTPSE